MSEVFECYRQNTKRSILCQCHEMIVAYGSCYKLQKGYCRDIIAYSALAIISEVNGYLNLVTIESYERSREPIKMERA